MKRPAKLSNADRELIAAATAAIKQRYRNDWQEVGAALRTRSGKIFTGINLDAYLGRMAVCAEAVALGRAFVDLGDAGIETIVAVRHPDPEENNQSVVVVSPCGACRELIFDYDRNARVIVPDPHPTLPRRRGRDPHPTLPRRRGREGRGAVVVPIADLLPNKYTRGPER